VTAAVYTDRRGVDDAEAGFVDGQPAVPDKASAASNSATTPTPRTAWLWFDFGYQPDEANKWYVRYYDAGTRNRDPKPLGLEFLRRSERRSRRSEWIRRHGNIREGLRDEKEYLKSRVFMIGDYVEARQRIPVDSRMNG